MILFLAVGLGLVAWSFSYIHLNLKSFSQISLTGHSDSELHLNSGGVITPPLATFIEETLALENITGLSVSVVPKFGGSELRTWGYRTEDGDEMTPDTLFYIGSLSKAFCVTAMGLLIDDFANGRNVTALPSGLTELTWHSRLKDLLLDWQLMDEWASERANLHDILSHVSGIPRHEISYGPSDTPQDALVGLKYLKPTFELRERFSYNNIMFMVAAHVIATYAGKSYTSFVEERIFLPLGMTSSTFSLAEAEASHKFTHAWTKRGRRLPAWFSEDMAFLVAGPGGIISNAIDMSKWISTWLCEGVYGNQTVIPLSVYQNASYAYTVAMDHSTNPYRSIVGYGMGWGRGSYRGHDIVHHSGGLPGHSTVLAFLPSDGLGVSVFANGDDQGAPAGAILDRILDAALGLPVASTVAHPSRPSCATTPVTPHPNPKYMSKARAHNTTSRLDALAGTYTNPGYGTLTLCSPSSSSPYCARVRSEFATVDQNDRINNHPMAEGDAGAFVDLLAAWPRFWASHVRMRYRQPDPEHDDEGSHANDAFDVYFTSLFPDGYGKDKTPFEFAEIGVPQGTVEFVVEDGRVVGFGMRDSALLERFMGVWFERV